jgi:CubicO group peptidase (beta-lactamase class C family)
MRKPLTTTSPAGFDRRHVLAGLGATLIATPRAFAGASPEQIGQRLAQAQQDGRVSGLHALLVSQGGKLVFEHYGQGDDEQAGRGPLGTVVFGPDVPHDLRSVSKGVVGLAYGIALAAGKVPPPEAKLYEQFPDYPDLAGQSGRDRVTIHHALSMTLGLDWDELTVPYSDPRNAETAMEASPDRFRFMLERPIVGEPGARWTYCGGATALLGRLIARGTGETLLAYCRRVLFDPMGFGPVAWAQGRDGEYRAASGLRLLPRDLLKIGQLVHAGGVWNGDQIVPRDWMKRAITLRWRSGMVAATAITGISAPMPLPRHSASNPGSAALGGAVSACTFFLRSTSSSRSTAATTTSPARNRGVSTMSSSARSCCQASSRFRVRPASTACLSYPFDPDNYMTNEQRLTSSNNSTHASVARTQSRSSP